VAQFFWTHSVFNKSSVACDNAVVVHLHELSLVLT